MKFLAKEERQRRRDWAAGQSLGYTAGGEAWSFALHLAGHSHWRPLQSEPLFHHLEKDFKSQIEKGDKRWLQKWMGASFNFVTDLLHSPGQETTLL